MKKGHVIILGGNKRAGKTTLAMKLHKQFGYNYYNYDMILDSLEETFSTLKNGGDEKYIKLLENMVERSLKDAENYGVSSVYEYIFKPSWLKNFKYRDKVEIVFLANLDANEKNIREDLKKYSKAYDWPSYVTSEDIERNVTWILNRNQELIEECNQYSFCLINTSRGEKREEVFRKLCIKLKNEENSNKNDEE